MEPSGRPQQTVNGSFVRSDSAAARGRDPSVAVVGPSPTPGGGPRGAAIWVAAVPASWPYSVELGVHTKSVVRGIYVLCITVPTIGKGGTDGHGTERPCAGAAEGAEPVATTVGPRPPGPSLLRSGSGRHLTDSLREGILWCMR